MAKPYEQEVLLDANGKPLFDVVDTLARKIEGIQKTIAKIQTDSFKSAKDFNSTLDANVKALQKASQQLSTISRQDATQRRQERALAASEARRNANQYGTNTTKVGYEFEREKALAALRAASSEKERIAALKQVELANARVAAVTKIAREEERIARAQSTARRTDDATAARAKVALARANANELVRSLGTEKAIEAAKSQQLIAERGVATATAVTRRERLASLAVANAELRAVERIAAANARAARSAAPAGPVGPGGNGPPGSRIGNILTPGYAGAAFARTSVYGAAAMGAYGAFNAVGSGFGGSVEMEDAFARLQAIANATDTQMQTLKASILDVAGASRYAVTDLIKISNTLAQAGVSATDMKNVLSAVTALATASGSTPDEAVNLVTSALGSFQLHASEAERIANLMTEALNRTRLTVGQVGQAIQYVGATAYEQNISLEQLLATIGSVAQAGVRSGSTIGTGFRQFLVDLQEPSKKLTEQLKLLGVSAADIDVSVRGLPAVLETLRNAGFGAAQAYEGLEVRAAAFYLTAKNNVDIADRLQLSFANTNASIVAQERAMNSLSAQWQRFKNLLQIGVADNLGSLITVLKNLLKELNDSLSQAPKTADEIAASRANENPLRTFERSVDEFLQGEGAKGLEKFLNFITEKDTYMGQRGGLGTWLRKLGEDSAGASAESKKLATQIAETNERIEGHQTRVAELDKEIIRLITQKESLRNNDIRSAAETATLTSRFEGLANQLVITGNRYDDLVNAARRYRVEQLRLLGVELQSQQVNTYKAAGEARTSLNSYVREAQGNRQLMQALTPQERGALNAMSSGVGTQQFQKGLGILAAAFGRLSKEGNKSADVLSKITGSAGSLATAKSQFDVISPQLGAVRAGQTREGQTLTQNTQVLTSLVERLQSQENGTPEKRALNSQAQGVIAASEALINRLLAQPQSSGNRAFLLDMQTEINSFKQQLKALNAVTADEVKAAKAAQKEKDKADRAAAKAEREANKGPLIRQADLDKVILDTLGAGTRLGSGQRTAAEQDALHRAGKTRATSATSSHSKPGGVARDIRTGPLSDAEGERLAQTLRQAFKSRGMDVFVKWENGRGPNNGSGPHIHTNTLGKRMRPGSASGASGEQAAEFKYDTQLDQAQLELDRKDMADRLKDIAGATTKATFDASVEAARVSMEKVNQGLMTAALNELANAGIGSGSPLFAAKMQQVNQSIAQNLEVFERGIADSLIKNAEAMMKAAQLSFDNAIAPSQRTVALMQGAASGFNNYSMRGRVPDSTRAILDARIAQAQETADRTKLANLPTLINSQQNALNTAQTTLDAGGLSPDRVVEYTLKIAELRKNVAGLIETKDALTAAFGVEGMLPQTLSEGLDQAITAYRELNNLNLSFAQMVNGEMLGAITTLHNALTNMFTSIMDGSRNVLQAMGDFAKAIIGAIFQIMAKIIATKIIKLLFSLFAPGQPLPADIAGSYNGGPAPTAGRTDIDTPGLYNGGPAIRGYAVGGPIMSGHSMRDSTLARVSKGEWIIRKAAVDSVGHEFMNQLNRKGSKALGDTQKSVAPIVIPPQPPINVWMVKPEDRPPPSQNDIVVAWANDVLSGGESRRLIQRVSREQ